MDPEGPKSVVVYKSPTCGCCTKWADHMRDAGFRVDEKVVADVDSVKDDLAVPAGLRSCHTAVVDGYVIEGHVPAAQVEQLLTRRPDVVGLAVPGMPLGSPGMESPTPEAYAVMMFARDGETTEFAQIPAGSVAPRTEPN